jgi:hypothetical protein
MTKQFTSSAKEAHLEQFHQSGLTQAAFCRQQGLVFKTFNKWLKDSKGIPAKSHPVKLPLVHSEQTTHHFQNEIPPTSSQAGFIPIHLSDYDSGASSKHQPPQPDCPPSSYQSALCFKTTRFSLAVSLDLSTEYGQVAMVSLTQALHKLPGVQDSYD